MTNRSRRLVSIIIPCYNYARYLGEAIESALAQTYEPIEIIVVDDGSTDDSAEVASRYPVIVIRQPNQGVCIAGNRGFAAAHGTFVLRLDADDRLAPTYVEETVAVLRDHPEAHFAYTAAAYFGARQGTYPIEPFAVESLAERNYVNASALMRRDSLCRVGGYNPNMAAGRYEDWDLWLSFAECGLPGIMVPKPLLLYRQHARGSRGTPRLTSLVALRREALMASRLQANHPRLLANTALVRRLARLPSRLIRREVSWRFAGLLVGLYGAMLSHALLHSLLAPIRSGVRLQRRQAPAGRAQPKLPG